MLRIAPLGRFITVKAAMGKIIVDALVGARIGPECGKSNKYRDLAIRQLVILYFWQERGLDLTCTLSQVQYI